MSKNFAFVLMACIIWCAFFWHGQSQETRNHSISTNDVRPFDQKILDRDLRNFAAVLEKRKKQQIGLDDFYRASYRSIQSAIDFLAVSKYKPRFFSIDEVPSIFGGLKSGPFWVDNAHVLYRSNGVSASLLAGKKTLSANGIDFHTAEKIPALILLNVDTLKYKVLDGVSIDGEVCFDQKTGRISYPYIIPRKLDGRKWRYISKRGYLKDGALNVQEFFYEGFGDPSKASHQEAPQFTTIDCIVSEKYSLVRGDDGYFGGRDKYTLERPDGEIRFINFSTAGIEGGQHPKIQYDNITDTYVVSYSNEDMSYTIRRYDRSFKVIEERIMPFQNEGFTRVVKNGFINQMCRYDKNNQYRNESYQRGNTSFYLCFSDNNWKKSAVMEGYPRTMDVSPDGCRVFGNVEKYPASHYLTWRNFLVDLCIE